MPSSSTRQTKSFLITQLAAAGVHPRKQHGQNFLIDLNLVDVLVDAAEIEPSDVVLEIGTGTGSLSARLAARAAHVVSAEIDPHLYQLACDVLAGVPNVTLLLIDALKTKNTLEPALVDAVLERLAEAGQSRVKVVANLPYSVATPLLSNLLDSPIVPHSMTVTIQKELADRVVARPSTKDYGSLAVWVQSQCDAEIVRTLPPEVFWPRPKVTSAYLRIVVRDDLRARIRDVPFFHAFVRSVFAHRRKFLRGVLLAAYKKELGKQGVDELLAQLELSPTARAEELSVEQLLVLSEAVKRALDKLPAPQDGSAEEADDSADEADVPHDEDEEPDAAQDDLDEAAG